MVNDRSVSFEFQELSELFPRMTDECNDNLIAMSYEDDQRCFQISEDQGIEDCHSGFSCFSCYFKKTIIV